MVSYSNKAQYFYRIILDDDINFRPEFFQVEYQ